jgi:hypothetical protein
MYHGSLLNDAELCPENVGTPTDVTATIYIKCRKKNVPRSIRSSNHRFV